MKKLLMVCCFVVSIVSLSKAQGGGGGRQQRSPADQAKQLQTQLSLTDDQTAKVTAIYTAQAAKRDSLMKAANGDMQAMRGQMRPMMAATTEKIKAVLTADQKTAYDKILADQAARRGGGQGGGGGTPPPPPSQE
jgi:Spy/CpxP family protein refolding chaperone